MVRTGCSCGTWSSATPSSVCGGWVHTLSQRRSWTACPPLVSTAVRVEGCNAGLGSGATPSHGKLWAESFPRERGMRPPPRGEALTVRETRDGNVVVCLMCFCTVPNARMVPSGGQARTHGRPPFRGGPSAPGVPCSRCARQSRAGHAPHPGPGDQAACWHNTPHPPRSQSAQRTALSASLPPAPPRPP